MRNLFLGIFAALTLALAGCRTADPSVIPRSYTRVANPDTNTVRLQLAVRKFVPAHRRGPAIWLAGTMHVGEPEYYHALQKFLDAQTVVLYEGINTDSHPRHLSGSSAGATGITATPVPSSPLPPPGERGQGVPGTNPSISTSVTSAGFSMQSALAESLGLVFQLNAIDYDRTNFLNSDLSVAEIQQLMAANTNVTPAKAGTPARSNPTFDALLQMMDGSSFLGSVFKLGIQFIGANPRLQALTKLGLIEAVGRMQGDFSTMRSMPPDFSQLVRVLIEARNQHAIADLKIELKTVPRSGSIAIFYGTGHMEDLEKHVVEDLHYRPADEIWFTAFSVDFQKAKISPAEVRFMRSLVKTQLDQMQ